MSRGDTPQGVNRFVVLAVCLAVALAMFAGAVFVGVADVAQPHPGMRSDQDSP